MIRLRKLYLANRTFFTYFFLWYFLVSSIIFSLSKQDAFLLTNSAHHPFLDYFFTIITQFGDGLFVIAIAFICFFLMSKRLGIAIATTYITSGLFCSLLKRSFDLHRPAFTLQSDPDFHVISWMPLAQHNAFPSGHTTSAFALATTFALFCKNKKLGLIALLLACLTGYSRVYLGQHYWDDVWFGSMLGLSFSCLYYLSFSYYLENNISFKSLSPPNFKI